MPLTELLDYFNREQRRQYGEHIVPEQALRMESGRVVADYAGLGLGTRFQPILPLGPDRPCGHEALLTVTGGAGPLTPSALFMIPTTADEIIYLDRLCRTVHALNFLLQPHSGGVLALNVHPRHLASVHEDHGLAFERILHQCGLGPGQVMLEIRPERIPRNVDLKRAVDNYRRHGYRIAFDHLATAPDDRLWADLKPDMIKLAPGLAEQPERLRDWVAESRRHGVPYSLALELDSASARRHGFTHAQADTEASPADHLTGPLWRRHCFP